MTALSNETIVAVAGAGAMGSGIAQVAASAGHPVLLFDAVSEVASRGRQRIAESLDGQVSKGRLKNPERDRIMARIDAVDSLDALGDAKLYALDGSASTIDGVSIIRTDGRTAVEHSLSIGTPVILYDLSLDPARASRIGLTASPNVSAESFQRVVSALQAQGKSVSRLADSPGLVVMRTMVMLSNEAYEAALQQVASLPAIDLAMRFGVNYPVGPIAWANSVGPKTVLDVLDAIHAMTGDPRYRASLGLRQSVLRERVMAS